MNDVPPFVTKENEKSVKKWLQNVNTLCTMKKKLLGIDKRIL